MACPGSKLGTELGVGLGFPAFCPMHSALGQLCLGRTQGIKEQAPELEVLAQAGTGPEVRKEVAAKCWVQVQPATGKGLGTARDCPGGRTRSLGAATCQALVCTISGLVYSRPERTLILEMRVSARLAKVTQPGGGRTRIPASVWAPETYGCLLLNPTL